MRPLKTELARIIATFVRDYQTTKNRADTWEEPLVGFAAADDPLMLALKTVVGPSHLLPGDLLADARTVIAYFIPFAKGIPKGNRGDRHASEEWGRAYIETNRLIEGVNRHVAERLDQEGYRSALLPPTHNFDPQRLVSDWSHKHVAYIAGLGKFGVHHLLITAKGCCGRLGSLVTNYDQPASKRPEGEFCLNRFNGSCLKCVAKCVAGALGPQALDRRRCYGMLLENAALYAGRGLADVCGKCTCIVPCSFKNPVARAILSQSGPRARRKGGEVT